MDFPVDELDLLPESDPIEAPDLAGIGLIPCPSITCQRWWSKWF